MPRMVGIRALWTLVRGGDVRGRLRATRQGQTALRLQLVGAALETGVLDVLSERAATTEELARRTGSADARLLAAFLRVVAAEGLVRSDGEGTWVLTTRGRSVLDDDLVRASYEAFAGFHTDLYREIRPLLAGAARRRDVLEQGDSREIRMVVTFHPDVRFGDITHLDARNLTKEALEKFEWS